MGHWSLTPPSDSILHMNLKTAIFSLLVLLALGAGSGLGFAQAQQVLMVVPAQNFRDQELLAPRQILTQAGVKVTVASTRMGELTGMEGAKVRSERLITEVMAQDYAAVVFVGGQGASQYFNDPQAQALARQALQHGRVVAAIGTAPVILARANLLKGKRATCSSPGKKELIAAGAHFTEKMVVVDGKLVTAAGPKAAKPFGLAILKILK